MVHPLATVLLMMEVGTPGEEVEALVVFEATVVSGQSQHVFPVISRNVKRERGGAYHTDISKHAS